MKRYFRTTRIAATLAVTAFLPVSTGFARTTEVIVAEDFSSTGNLNGHAPAEAPPGTFWRSGDKDRTVMVEDGSARARLTQALSAALEVALGDPGRYVLSMEVEFPPLLEGAEESWVALGFSEGARVERAFNDSGEGGAAGSPWILFRWRGSAQVFAGKGVARPLGAPTEARYAPEEKHLLKLVLDTYEESWKLEASINGEPMKIGRGNSEVYTFTRPPAIRYIGFSVYSNGEIETGENPEVKIHSFRLEKEAEE